MHRRPEPKIKINYLSSLWETLFLDQLLDFSLLSSNSFLHSFWKSKFMKQNSLTPKKFIFLGWFLCHSWLSGWVLDWFTREFDPYWRQFLRFPERVWLSRDSTFPKPNQMTFCNIFSAIYSKKTCMAVQLPNRQRRDHFSIS